ncbi:YihY/virulence factor BrkB family protein [Kibdelosporangium phytohabitans]|uniref:YihY/virulence factor BrkB family protein n=1 Tax=Kibdelosporangium phytohabitans TaxID=860235 RepID=UPI0019EA7888|nr:YhjD/YihY/BrkB family envelope integrity protein [Kibdelosporangium phytohabitans]MBE1462392.1 membrane protein [Kibdelosporangium phytohabitans]
MITRLRTRYAWFDHLARTIDRYVEHNAYQYAAAITYFSVLSVVPVLMVGLSTAGFIIADDKEVAADLRTTIVQALPSGLDGFATEIYDGVITQRASLGVFGLVIGLYAGWGWMNALRDALTAMWELERPALPFFRTILWDLLALMSLGVALLVSFALTAVGSWLNSSVLRWIGMSDQPWAGTVLSLLSVPLAILADWLVFLWVLVRLPRAKVNTHKAVRGALAAAIGFEFLKIGANLYLSLLGRSPTSKAFGSVIGLLVFIYLVARLLLLVAAWIATSRTPAERQPDSAPGYLERTTATPAAPLPGLATAGWLVATGAVAALWLQRIFRQRPRKTRPK